MLSVRDIFIQALAMKQQGKSASAIRDALIDLGHDNGHSIITEVGNGAEYKLTFEGTAESIHFDGTSFHFER